MTGDSCNFLNIQDDTLIITYSPGPTRDSRPQLLAELHCLRQGGNGIHVASRWAGFPAERGVWAVIGWAARLQRPRLGPQGGSAGRSAGPPTT